MKFCKKCGRMLMSDGVGGYNCYCGHVNNDDETLIENNTPNVVSSPPVATKLKFSGSHNTTDTHIYKRENSQNVTTNDSAVKAGNNTYEIRCPKCKSINIQVLGNDRKSFSAGKALGGALLTGGIGLLAGFAGSKGMYDCFCKNCGNRFKIF